MLTPFVLYLTNVNAVFLQHKNLGFRTFVSLSSLARDGNSLHITDHVYCILFCCSSHLLLLLKMQIRC